MEVLACIPELPCLSGSGLATVCEPTNATAVPVASHPTEVATPEPEVLADVEDDEADEADDGDLVSPAPYFPAGRPSRSSGLFSPSIIVLAAVAAFVWTAAWRNDRLRLEASRQQRPERLARELPATAGAARIATP